MGVTGHPGAFGRPSGAKLLSAPGARFRPRDRHLTDPSAAPSPVTVRIPADIARQIRARIDGSGFASIDAFVEYVLARLLEQSGEVPFSEEDERRLRERLRSLGYID